MIIFSSDSSCPLFPVNMAYFVFPCYKASQEVRQDEANCPWEIDKILMIKNQVSCCCIVISVPIRTQFVGFNQSNPLTFCQSCQGSNWCDYHILSPNFDSFIMHKNINMVRQSTVAEKCNNI